MYKQVSTTHLGNWLGVHCELFPPLLSISNSASVDTEQIRAVTIADIGSDLCAPARNTHTHPYTNPHTKKSN